jgi:hypothetical protein
MRNWVLLLLAALTLASCTSWLRAPPAQIEPEGGYRPAPIDDRPLADQIIDVTVEPTPGGVIVSAKGLPPTQGYWNADLVKLEDSAPGTVTYHFRMRPPLAAERVGSPLSREVVAGAYLSNTELAGVRQITVIGAQNSRSRSR